MTYPSTNPPKSLLFRISFAVERFIVTRLTPKKVGPGMRLVFKLPVLFYRLGLGGLLGSKILMLVTRGRRSGKRRYTALEYGRDSATGVYLVMTGWGGRSDWYRNALHTPQVELWVGRQRFQACAEPMTGAEIAAYLEEMARVYPPVTSLWNGSSGIPYDGTPECLEKMAAYFPALVIRPVGKSDNPLGEK